MVASALTSVIEILATMGSCGLFLSLAPEMRRIHSEKSVACLPFLPIISMFGMCACGVVYGYLIDNYFPVLAANALGMVVAMGYTAIYARNAGSVRAAILRYFGLSVLAVAALVLYCVWSPSPHDSLKTQVGCVCVTLVALLFASPLVVLKQVIQYKNSVFLPATMVFVGLFNSVLWAVYGLIIDDMFVAVPNFVNLALGLTQLALIIVFPKRPRSNREDLEIGNSAVVVISPDPVSDQDAYFSTLKSPQP